MESLKIVVTGASGFVGSNVARHLSKDNEVVGLTRSVGNWRTEGINVEYLDICDRGKTIDMLKKLKPDVLIHCAVYGGYHFEKDTEKVIKTNILGTLNLLDASENTSLFINTGSSSEYGLKQKPMKETDTLEPSTDYAMSKALVSNLLHLRKSMSKAVTLRLFSVYGYYEEKHRLIPTLLYSLIKGERAKLSNPENVRDFVFVEDVSRAYEKVIKNSDNINSGEIFNVGSGVQSKISEVVRMLDVDVVWDNEDREPEKKRVWQADIEKIKKEIGWIPETALKEGLEKTKKWMEENIALYEGPKNEKHR